MVIKTATGSTIYVTTEQGEQIKEALRQGVEYIDIKDSLIKASAILSIENTGQTGQYSSFKELALSAPSEDLTDAQRQHNLARIQKLKAQLRSKNHLDIMDS